uniref:Uncharacterized protein n=1 Tax=Micrurus surinamensis TaxID=129470 RepID=A0A2D4PB09_MICSU
MQQAFKGLPERRGGNVFSKAPEDKTRSNGWKLNKERSKLRLRRNFLTVRTINQWTCLSPEVLGAPTLEIFKKRLDSLAPRSLLNVILIPFPGPPLRSKMWL